MVGLPCAGPSDLCRLRNRFTTTRRVPVHAVALSSKGSISLPRGCHAEPDSEGSWRSEAGEADPRVSGDRVASSPEPARSRPGNRGSARRSSRRAFDGAGRRTGRRCRARPPEGRGRACRAVGRRTPRRRDALVATTSRSSSAGIAASVARASLRSRAERPPWRTTRFRATPRSFWAKNSRWSRRSVRSRGDRALLERGDHVVEDERVPGLVGRHRGVETLNRIPRFPGGRERGLPDDEPVGESARCSRRLRAHREANGAELHLDDRVVPIAPARSRGEAEDEPRLHLGEDARERAR